MLVRPEFDGDEGVLRVELGLLLLEPDGARYISEFDLFMVEGEVFVRL